MPRGIGTSSGVKLTRTVAVGRGRTRFWMISGVCRCTPPTPYAAGAAHHLAAEQVRLGGLAGAAGAGGGDHDDVGLDQAGGDRGREGERGDRRVAAGYGDPAWRRAAASRWPGSSGRP